VIADKGWLPKNQHLANPGEGEALAVKLMTVSKRRII
jgi:hypothetical protein